MDNSSSSGIQNMPKSNPDGLHRNTLTNDWRSLSGKQSLGNARLCVKGLEQPGDMTAKGIK